MWCYTLKDNMGGGEGTREWGMRTIEGRRQKAEGRRQGTVGVGILGMVGGSLRIGLWGWGIAVHAVHYRVCFVLVGASGWPQPFGLVGFGG